MIKMFCHPPKNVIASQFNIVYVDLHIKLYASMPIFVKLKVIFFKSKKK